MLFPFRERDRFRFVDVVHWHLDLMNCSAHLWLPSSRREIPRRDVPVYPVRSVSGRVRFAKFSSHEQGIWHGCHLVLRTSSSQSGESVSNGRLSPVDRRSGWRRGARGSPVGSGLSSR